MTSLIQTILNHIDTLTSAGASLGFTKRKRQSTKQLAPLIEQNSRLRKELGIPKYRSNDEPIVREVHTTFQPNQVQPPGPISWQSTSHDLTALLRTPWFRYKIRCNHKPLLASHHSTDIIAVGYD
jgi:hypothetical protein